MKLKILTLTWNAQDKIEALWPGLKENMDSCGIDCEWHVRDNGSKDKTIEFLEGKAGVHVYPVGHNRDSFATGVNFLFDKASPADDDFVLMLNNDVIFGEPNALKKMISLMKSDNNIGVVGARILYPNTNILQHAGVIFSKKYNYMPFHNGWGQESTKDDEKIKEFQAVTAAVCLIKADCFRKICTDNKSGLPGYCEKFIWCFEDIDGCLSIKYNMNKKIMYHGGVKVFHEESASLKKNNINKLFMGKNAKTFRDKWFGKYEIDG